MHVPLLICTYLRGTLREVEQHVVHLRETGMRSAHGGWPAKPFWPIGGLRGGRRACAHRHGLRVVLVVQLGWSGLLRASRAQFEVLVAHLDQSGVFGAWSTVARGGRGLRVRLHLLACERRVTGEYV